MADKLKMHTENLADKNFEVLSKMFPNALTETITGYDDDGKPIVERAIDADVFRQEISCKVVEGKDERYQFTWPDKKKAVLLANTPIDKTLRPCREESVDFDNTENLYIEGDNLEVLKLLHEAYLNKVKVIYIDPPYNTGNDFVYEDDFIQSMDEYRKNSGQFDDDGNRLVKNMDSNGRFHTDWLNMIYPRLKIAKDLLTDDGVIFISIDDSEYDNMKKICDEIFGELNNLSNLCVEMSKTQGMKVAAAQKGKIVKNHEYILIYQKNVSYEYPRQPLYDKAENWDVHFDCVIIKEGEKYKKYELSQYIKDRYSYIYEKFCKYNFVNKGKIDIKFIGKAIEIDDEIKKFFYTDISKDIYQEMACSISVNNDIIVKLKNDEIVGYNKYLLTMSSGGKIRQYRNLYENLKQTDDYFSDYSRATIRGALWKGFYSDMMNIAKEGNINFKNGKKPIRLMSQLLKWSGYKDGIVLDFFAGSSSTAHSVMQLNAEDGGNRNFIMVQLMEEIDCKSEEYKAGYTNICEIGKERIRRAARKISEDHPYAVFDGGFRVLKCDSSNMKDIYYTPSETQQSLFDTYADNIKEDRTPEDLLFQVMLDLGVLLSSKIEETTIAGKQVFNVADGFLIACFDNDVTEETVKAVAEKKPYYAVFRDSSMANDSVATNFDQIFASISPETVRKVL